MVLSGGSLRAATAAIGTAVLFTFAVSDLTLGCSSSQLSFFTLLGIEPIGHWRACNFPLPTWPFLSGDPQVLLLEMGVSCVLGDIPRSLLFSVWSSDLLSDRLNIGFSTPASGRGGLLSLLPMLPGILMVATLLIGGWPLPFTATGIRVRYFLLEESNNQSSTNFT